MTMETNIYSMKVIEAKEYIEECIKVLNNIKGTNIQLLDKEAIKTRPSAKVCDHARFTLGLKNTDFCFGLMLDLWVNIDERNKLEYQKCLMSEIWKRVKEGLLKHNEQAILNGLQISKATLNGLGTYEPPATKRSNPIYIDPDSAYIDTGVLYSKTDIDMTLEGYRHQQIVKQHRKPEKEESGKYVF